MATNKTSGETGNIPVDSDDEGDHDNDNDDDDDDEANEAGSLGRIQCCVVIGSVQSGTETVSLKQI